MTNTRYRVIRTDDGRGRVVDLLTGSYASYAMPITDARTYANELEATR